MTILVTSGAGFIGSNFVIDWLDQHDERVINVDKLTYAGNLNNLSSVESNASHVFVKGDMGDPALLKSLLSRYKPRAIINFAAESHVDRSIHGQEGFAHGFLTLSETAEFLYKTTSYYAASHEKSIQWNDQTLNVAWPLEGFPNISEKDKNINQTFNEGIAL